MEAADTEVNNPVSKVIQLLISKAGWGVESNSDGVVWPGWPGAGGGNAPSKPPLHRDTVSFHPLPQEGAGAPHNQRRGGRANGILKTSRVSEPGGPRPHIPTDRTALLQLGNFTMGSKRKQQRDRCSGTVYSGALLPFDE